jgi:hypothetical protein
LKKKQKKTKTGFIFFFENYIAEMEGIKMDDRHVTIFFTATTPTISVSRPSNNPAIEAPEDTAQHRFFQMEGLYTDFKRGQFMDLLQLWIFALYFSV